MEVLRTDLERLGDIWLFQKVQRMKNLLKIAEPDEALYRELMVSLGYPKNRVQFLNLALLLPFKEIRLLKTKDLIRKALLYRAGFEENVDELPPFFDLSLRMERFQWVEKGIRPANHPRRRLEGASLFLEELAGIGAVNFFLSRIKGWKRKIENSVDASAFVRRVMELSGVGIQRRQESFFNVILPFFLALFPREVESQLRVVFELHPPLASNFLIKSFLQKYPHILPASTREHFGIIMLMKNSRGGSINTP
ncbi:MAG: DUF2851 domain-containing protein [Aquificaceae bacterium]|uniref:DUF2851 domain-containing protein n=1 Tax=Hydrogenobacter sp. Uz 6-8 TaxID=3384828 RepID=UPI00309BACAE